jgi:hypothetical protein
VVSSLAKKILTALTLSDKKSARPVISALLNTFSSKILNSDNALRFFDLRTVEALDWLTAQPL